MNDPTDDDKEAEVLRIVPRPLLPPACPPIRTSTLLPPEAPDKNDPEVDAALHATDQVEALADLALVRGFYALARKMPYLQAKDLVSALAMLSTRKRRSKGGDDPTEDDEALQSILRLNRPTDG